jgi:hypothetical protein
VVSLLLFFGGLIGIYLNHRWALWASEIAAAAPTEPEAEAAEEMEGEAQA